MLTIRKIKCKQCKRVDEVATSQKGRIDYTCSNCNTSHIYSSFTPPWVNTLRADPGRMDAAHDTKVAEAMLIERTKAMRSSHQARSWEQGRKAELTKYKPEWVKKGRNIKNLPK